MSVAASSPAEGDVQPAAGDALARARTFALDCARDANQRRLFALAFDDARRRGGDAGRAPDTLDCVRLPQLIHLAVLGDHALVPPLAEALSVLYVGMDLWDSVMDRELGPTWDGERPDAVALAAAALIGGVGPLALARVPAPTAMALEMQCALARAFIEVAAGQQRDLSLSGAVDASSDAAVAAIAGKSGAVIALFAELAALLAGAPAEVVTAYAEMGRAIGIAGQIRSDLADLADPAQGRDLAGGARTLPLAFLLETTPADERAALNAMLARARTDKAVRETVCRRLEESGAAGACVALIRVQCGLARRALARSGARSPACEAFQRLIDSLALV